MMHLQTIMSKQDFLALYEEHSDSIFRHCYLWLQDREKGIEIMCEAFKRLWLFASAGNTVDSAKLFLYREATVLLRDMQSTSEDATKEEPAGKASFYFLRQLAPDDRHVCLFHYVGNLSCVEIADIIGGSADIHKHTLDTVCNRFHAPDYVS